MGKVKCLEDLNNARGHFHELRGARKGQWACSLSKDFRLVFKPNNFGNLIDNEKGWTWIRHVLILQIIDYH